MELEREAPWNTWTGKFYKNMFSDQYNMHNLILRSFMVTNRKKRNSQRLFYDPFVDLKRNLVYLGFGLLFALGHV